MRNKEMMMKILIKVLAWFSNREMCNDSQESKRGLNLKEEEFHNGLEFQIVSIDVGKHIQMKSHQV